MPHITLRKNAGSESADDLQVSVQDKTFDHLMTTVAPTIRVSAYLDRDCPRVEAEYAELFVSDECRFTTTIETVIPGSRSRTGIELPGAMSEGEQLTVIVNRAPRAK